MRRRCYDPTQPITRPLDPEHVDTLVHTEKGAVHCIFPVTGEQRDLAFQGFETDRDTLKYRCPAAAYGLECKGQKHPLLTASAIIGRIIGPQLLRP